MRQALNQKTSAAVSSVRVSTPRFQLIVNDELGGSVPSCDDYTGTYPGSANDGRIWFKPGGFYFRREIRSARVIFKVRGIAEMVAYEHSHLAQWALKWDAQAAIFEVACSVKHDALKREALMDGARDAALKMVDDLERLQAWVRDHLDLIPPRWMGTHSEAAEKGWEAEAAQ